MLYRVVAEPMSAKFRLQPERVKGLIKAKLLDRKDFIRAFGKVKWDSWLLRLESPNHRDPSFSDGIVLGRMLEIDVEFLGGAPTRYDAILKSGSYEAVAAHGSLERFLTETPEGQTATPDLIPLLREQLDDTADLPRTVEIWKRRYERLVRQVQHGQTRNEPLDRMMNTETTSPQEQTSEGSDIPPI
jgi:hypothetical protein